MILNVINGMEKSSKKSVGRPRGSGTGQARELTPEEVERLTKCCGTRDRALVWLCLGGGLRVSEAVHMRREHVSSDGSVLVEGSTAKSRETRRVWLTPQARKHLAAYLLERGSAPASAPLFPSRSGGGHMHPNWACRLVDGLLKAAGVDGATSHSLRRTHANTLRRQGVDVVVIKDQLGHASLATTAAYLSASALERAETLARIRF